HGRECDGTSRTTERSGRYGSRGVRRRYGTGNDAWTSQKQMSEDRAAGGQGLPRKERQGLPEATPRGNSMHPLAWAFRERPQARKNNGKTTEPMDRPRRNRLSISTACLS